MKSTIYMSSLWIPQVTKPCNVLSELMIEKIQQVEDNWQQPWFSTKGWGLPQNIDGRELQRGQFLYAVFTDGKGAVWHAGLYDFHAGQGKGAERIEGGTLLPGGLLELQHQGQEREEDYHGPVPPSQQGGAGELQGDPLYEDPTTSSM